MLWPVEGCEHALLGVGESEAEGQKVLCIFRPRPGAFFYMTLEVVRLQEEIAVLTEQRNQSAMSAVHWRAKWESLKQELAVLKGRGQSERADDRDRDRRVQPEGMEEYRPEPISADASFSVGEDISSAEIDDLVQGRELWLLWIFDVSYIIHFTEDLGCD